MHGDLAPAYGDCRKSLLQEIANLTGGQFIAEELGIKLETISLKDLGEARRVVLDKDTPTIIDGGGDKAAIEGRCNDIRKQITKTTANYDREKAADGGVVVAQMRAGQGNFGFAAARIIQAF